MAEQITIEAPEPLPEFPVEAPPLPGGLDVPLEAFVAPPGFNPQFPFLTTQPSVPGPPGSALAGGSGVLTALSRFVLGPLVLLLTPMPTAPEPSPDDPGMRPPPRLPPGADEPITPPNWDDLIGAPERPFPTRDLPFPSAPPADVDLPEFLVSPPSASPSPLNPALPVPYWWEFPFGSPNYELDPGPRSTPAPTSPPGVDPVLDPFAEPVAFPDGTSRPRPARPPAPDVLSDPLPDLIGNPFGNPFPAPTLPSGPRTAPRTPTGPLIPFDFAPPGVGTQPFAPEIPLKPPTKADPCGCGKKKKPKSKRKERDVCYRGTYIERKSGLSKTKIEQVPCEGAPPKKARAPRKGSRPGQFPGLTQSERGTGLFDYLQNLAQGSDLIDEVLGRIPKKATKPKRLKKGRKPKTTVPRVPGTIYTTPFPQ